MPWHGAHHQLIAGDVRMNLLGGLTSLFGPLNDYFCHIDHSGIHSFHLAVFLTVEKS